MMFRHQMYNESHPGTNSQNGVVMLSLRQSFKPGEVTAEQAHALMSELAAEFIGDKFQYVIATHVDKRCVHSHVMMNYISEENQKWVNKFLSSYEFQKVSDRICEEHGLSVLPPCIGGSDHRYSKRSANCYRTVIRNDIDRIISAVSSYEEFLQALSETYFVKTSGKYLSVRHRTNGQKRNIRVYTLRGPYSESEIRQRITGDVPEKLLQTEREQMEYVRSLFAAHHFLQSEQIDGYEALFKKIDHLTDLQERVQDKIKNCVETVAQLDSILTALQTYHDYKEVQEEYERSLLPERFLETHQVELKAFSEAETLLQKSQISVTEDAASFQKEKEHCIEQLADLENRYEAVAEEIAEINSIKRTIDTVLYTRQSTEKTKGVKDYGR